MKEETLIIESKHESEKIYTINDAAEILCVHQQTLRNWEKKKLIEPLRAGQRRIYTSEDLHRCRKIKEYSGRGINLKAVKELMDKN